MPEIEYNEFLKKLESTKSIKCNRWNAMDGDLLYHVLDIYDRENIAVNYYGKHKQYWHYSFYTAYELWFIYREGWIELRQDA